jgi:two-component system, response regulator YesN
MNIFLTDITLRDLQNGSSEDLEILLSEAANASTSESVQNALDLFCKTYLEQIHTAVNGVSPAIKLAIEYINQHYNQKIVLDDVAAQVFLNRSYLSQLFKKEMEVSFGDYLEKIRINNSKHLILDSTKSMSEVAESVGFSNQNYFTKVFKKVTGVSPLKYKWHE